MNYRPYESLTQRGIRRNRENERAILASSICAFISSFFANATTNGQLGFGTFAFIPIFVVLYIVLYWIYLLVYKGVQNCKWMSRTVFGKLYREDVLHIINIEIIEDLTDLLKECADNSVNQELLSARATYQIANILSFMENYSSAVYISHSPKNRHIASPDSFVAKSTIDTIFKEMEEVSIICIKDESTIKQMKDQIESVKSLYSIKLRKI